VAAMLLNCRFLKNKKNETGYPKRKITYWIKNMQKRKKSKKRKNRLSASYPEVAIFIFWNISPAIQCCNSVDNFAIQNSTSGERERVYL